MLVKKVQMALYSQQACIKLKQPYQVFSSASYSGVLSLASFVVFHNPKLPPPKFKGQLSYQISFDYKLADKKLSNIHYFQPWCDYFASLLEKGSAYMDNDEILYVIDKVNQDYLQCFNAQVIQVQKWDEYEQSCSMERRLQHIFGIKMQEKHKKLNIGIANFGTAQLRNDPFKPKVNIQSILQGIWFGNHNWTNYEILRSSFPSQRQFQDMDILILTGSSLCVNDETPQIENFMKLFKSVFDKNKKLRAIGICFGHQLLAKNFGGKVIKKSYISGIENIRFNHKIAKQIGLLITLKQQDITLAMSQFHQDYVDVLPKNFINFASSKSAENQAAISCDHRMISFQCHPEYTTQWAQSYTCRLAGRKVTDILHDFNVVGSSSKQHTQSIWCMRKAISNFIQKENK